MSRAAVRSAIVAYLQAKSSNTVVGGDNTIPFLSNTYGFPAAYTKEPAFYDPTVASRTDGAVIYLYWPDQKENRTLFGGPAGALRGGEKQVTYTVNMDCFFKSSSSDMQTVGANNEAFLDGLVAAIRADRQAGAPGVIFQWGEGARNAGEPDIEVNADYPVPIKANLAVVYSKVVVTVIQMLEQT